MQTYNLIYLIIGFYHRMIPGSSIVRGDTSSK
jgi:hypothetical protein